MAGATKSELSVHETRRAPGPAKGTPAEVFLVFLKLGLTSFGGPVAHLGYFQQEFVVRRRWLAQRSYADVVALCQFLPGPASSQVGLAIGLSHAGYLGALAAWAGFTLPSALILILFAYSFVGLQSLIGTGWLNGLKAAAVAVVALAVASMARSLAPDRSRATLAVAAAILALTFPSTSGQLGAIALGGLVGLALNAEATSEDDAALPLTVSPGVAVAALIAFFGLLILLPLAQAALNSPALAQFAAFYRAGSLVFGGGHVVLPLLQAEVVPTGWVTHDAFLAGYGAAQAVPGPLFTFAAYLGAVIGGWSMALLCLIAVFLPSFLLVLGALPFWEALRRTARIQAALKGVNAAVVGLLLAALYDPVWTAGVRNARDFALALGAFLFLFMWQWPPWLVVILSAAAGVAVAHLF
jgi:chromate transporter